MVDYDKQQILQRLEDDALAEARRKAQEDAQAQVASSSDNIEEEEGQAGVNADEEGVDTDDVTG